MAKKAKQLETKLKKKRWFSIIAPKIFSEQIMGETFLENPKDLQDRTISVNLMSLTGDPKKQSINMIFRIYEVRDNKGITECFGYDMATSNVKRIVRRNRERIDDSFVVNTADGKTIRIKPLLMTKFNTSRSVTGGVRKALRREAVKAITTTTFDDLIHDIVSNKFQLKLKDILKKIYPITSCEVRSLRVVTSAGVKPITVTTDLAEEKKPEQEAEEPVVTEAGQ